MKVSEITFHTIFSALKHQWKVFLATALLFAALGAGAGFFFADSLSTQAEGSAVELAPVDFSTVPYDRHYYIVCQNLVNNTYTDITNYLPVLFNEPTLTESQRETLLELKSNLEDFHRGILSPLLADFSAVTAIQVPPEFLSEVTEDRKERLKSTQMELLVAEAAAELVKNMQAPAFASNTITAAYETLLSQAAQYGALQRDVLIYEQHVQILTETPSVVLAAGRKAEADLTRAAEELNALIGDLNQFAAQMAAENHINIALLYGEDPAFTVKIAHTHGARSSQEAFAVLALFCVLVGICSGIFFAVCREAAAEKKRQPAAPQNPF